MLLAAGVTTQAQVIDRKVEEAKNRTNQRIENKSSEAIEKGLDKIEKGIGNIFKKKKKDKKESPGSPEMMPGNNGPAAGDVPDFTVYKGSDFVPGKQVLFFEDFTTGASQWEINEWDRGDAMPPGINTPGEQNGNWYKAPRKGNIIPLPVRDLPDQFTLEFDLYPNLETMSEMEGGFKTIIVRSGTDRKEYSIHFNDQPQVQLDVHPSSEIVYISATSEYGQDERNLFSKEIRNGWKQGQAKHISISRDKSHIRLYIDGTRYMDLPNGLPQTGKYTLLFSSNLWGDGLYFTNVRLATGLQQASTEIAKTGKFVTNSIYFDINSSRIMPASWPTLKQAAAAIQASSGTILINGHTDSDGNDDANLVLSQKRADAVKAALVKEFKIDASRLITSGKGEATPLEPNSTAAGKAKNRRVEFIKQ